MIDSKERSFFSFVIASLVTSPGKYYKFQNIQFENSVLKEAFNRLLSKFADFIWLETNEKEDVMQIQQIIEKLAESNDYSAQIATHTLKWALNNHMRRHYHRRNQY